MRFGEDRRKPREKVIDRGSDDLYVAVVHFQRMSANRSLRIPLVFGVIVVLTGLGLWYCTSTSQIKVASTFKAEDVRAIRNEVSARRWAEVRQSISTLNIKRAWSFALPILFSRTESISGFPGPPGGARVQCRSVLFDTECAYMVFNSTNGWKCDSMSFIDASMMREIRQQLQSRCAAEKR